MTQKCSGVYIFEKRKGPPVSRIECLGHVALLSRTSPDNKIRARRPSTKRDFSIASLREAMRCEGCNKEDIISLQGNLAVGYEPA
jgi:hypothetical protein